MPSETEPKRTKMVVLGTAVIVVGLVAAIALWFAGGSRRTEAIENLARAPIGCDTTLDFSVPGEYLIFVETQGSFAEVRGDCDSSGEFSVGASRPDVDITVLDPDGKQLDLDARRDAVTYATSDFVGRSVLVVQVEETGDHVMRVEAEGDTEFAVAVGRDPNSGVALLRGAAVAVGLIGLVLGLLLALIAGRKRQRAVPDWTPAQPAGQWSPGQPPYQQPAHPPYSQPAHPPYQQPGGYQQPGQYGPAPQQPPAAPQIPSMPQPPPAQLNSFAPAVPTANPFAPPAGAPQNVPAGGVPMIPDHPTTPGAGSGDGATGWPGDDAPTPPRGTPVTPIEGSRPPDTDVDRWDTSQPTPPQ